jgi:hypothetical protein
VQLQNVNICKVRILDPPYKQSCLYIITEMNCLFIYQPIRRDTTQEQLQSLLFILITAKLNITPPTSLCKAAKWHTCCLKFVVVVVNYVALLSTAYSDTSKCTRPPHFFLVFRMSPFQLFTPLLLVFSYIPLLCTLRSQIHRGSRYQNTFSSVQPSRPVLSARRSDITTIFKNCFCYDVMYDCFYDNLILRVSIPLCL